MALSLTTQPAKDGGGTSITGGTRWNSEGPSGPIDQVAVLIDSTQSEILGTTIDAAINDAAGSINAHVRGVAKNTAAAALETGGNLAAAATSLTAVAAVAGTTSGAGVTTNATGTIQQYLRGIVTILAAAVAGISGALFQKITDGTNTAVVKAASTAPVAADAALVVGISPNLPSIAPVVSTASEASHVFKASAGAVFGCYAVNLSSSSGFLVLINATSVPSDGAITPLAVMPIQVGGFAEISGALLATLSFSTGIVAVLTSAATPFTKTTTGGLTGFFSCQFE